jgi:hypothetical protein
VGPQDAPPEDEHPWHFFAIAEMSLSRSVDPHDGHATSTGEPITSSSNSLPHFLHSYSKMGIGATSSRTAPLMYLLLFHA